MLPPNIPLRAGPSGPLVNLASLLENLDGLISIRRIWNGLGHGFDLPVNSVVPGTDIIDFDIVWGAEEVALGAQNRLAYVGFMYGAAEAPQLRPGYPSQLLLVHNWRAAEAVAWTTLQTMVMPVHVTGEEPEEDVYNAHAGFSFLRRPNDNAPPFVIGTNRTALSIANYDQSVASLADVNTFTLIEIVCNPDLATFEEFYPA